MHRYLCLFTLSFLFSLFFLGFLLIFNSRIQNNNFSYATPGVRYSGLSVATKKESIDIKSLNLLKNTIITIKFKSSFNNLGIIAIPFSTNNMEEVDDNIIFRIKEADSNEWLYQREYNTRQIRDREPFPFGFPVIKDSNNKEYVFEVKSLNGSKENHLSLIGNETYFYSKYTISKLEALNFYNFFSFFFFKFHSELMFITPIELVLIFALMFSPVIFILNKRSKAKLNKLMKKLSKKIELLDKYYFIVPISIIGFYNLIFFNKYIPVTEGWFSTYAWMFNEGKFPYKDFYFLLPPLYLFKISLFTKAFGYSLLYLRIFGIAVILAMTLFLYKNLEFVFKKTTAVILTIIGIIYYQSGVAHITYDFIQFLTLYGLIQSYLLLKFISSSKKNILWIFWAGFFASLAFLTKQSNGFMIDTFSFLGLIIVSLKETKRDLLKTILYYLAGILLPIAITILWLWDNHALSQFRDQCFAGAASAKGGISKILFGWLNGVLSLNFFSKVKILTILFFILGYWRYMFKKNRKKENLNGLTLLFMVILIIICVFTPLILGKNIPDDFFLLGKLGMSGVNGINYVIVSSFLTTSILILVAFYRLFSKKEINKNLSLLALLSFGFMYGTGTSAGISEAGAFLGFIIFVGLILSLRSFYNIGKIFVLMFCLSFTLLLAENKYMRPYLWWGLSTSDIRHKLVTTDKIPILKGMYSSEDNIRLLEEVSEITNLKKDDNFIIFPNIPVFYLINHKFPPGKALVYWFDFLPDSSALKEADLIKKTTVKAVVYLELGEEVWSAHEFGFRNGHLSGQRKVKEAIMSVIKKEKMQILIKYHLQNNIELIVWKTV